MAHDYKQKQLELAEKLQLKLLERWERLIDEGQLTPTDAATLARLLSQNGWSIDPARLPQGLRDKLTKRIDPLQFEDGDADLPHQ